MKKKAFFIAVFFVALCSVTASFALPHKYTFFDNLNKQTQNLSVRCIVQSKDGMVWFGTENGLYSYDGYNLRYHEMEIEAKVTNKDNADIGGINNMYADGDSLFIGCDNEVLLFDLGTYRFTLIPHSQQDNVRSMIKKKSDSWKLKNEVSFIPKDIPSLKSICYDKRGNTLVGTDNGLYIIEKNKAVHHLMHDARIDYSLAGDAISCIFRDKDFNIWIGTNSGVSLIRENGILTAYSLPSITGEGSGNQLFCVFCDSKRRYWLGGSNGVICTENLGTTDQNYRWYRQNDAKYPIAHNRVRCILEDDKKHIWVGGDMGLILLNEETMQFVHYSIEGDTDNAVYGLENGKNGELEITTISKTYTVKTDLEKQSLKVLKKVQRDKDNKSADSFNRFMKEIGLQGHFLSLYSYNDTLIFGGMDMFIVFNTKKAIAQKTFRMPVVTDIRLNDSVFINREDILACEYSFAPEDKMIEVFVSDFDNSREYLDDYYYQIEEGQPWIRTNIQKGPIILAGLAPGKYRLMLKRTGKDDEPVCVYSFTIRAPWYDTTLAHIIYVAIFLLIAYGIYHIVQQRKRMKIERQQKEELLAKAKEKEKELLSDNEYLESQLRLQLIEKSGAEGELSSDERFLLEITKLIEQNMDDSELNVNKLSELSGISSKQMYRRIKAMTGMTTVAYIRDQRLKKAASLLSKGSFTVSEVLYMVGFSSASYFTRCFQEEYGMSPSEYREQK